MFQVEKIGGPPRDAREASPRPRSPSCCSDGSIGDERPQKPQTLDLKISFTKFLSFLIVLADFCLPKMPVIDRAVTLVKDFFLPHISHGDDLWLALRLTETQFMREILN